MDKTGSELDLDSIKFFGADPASDPISAFYEQVGDMLLCKGLGGTYPGYSSPNDDDLVTVSVHVAMLIYLNSAFSKLSALFA